MHITSNYGAKVYNDVGMSMKTKPTSDNLSYVIHAYTVDHRTTRDIAGELGVSYATISNWLRKAGISASDGEHAKVVCSGCGKEFTKFRSRLRKRNFCTPECFQSLRQQRPYVQDRQGQRIARATVSKYYTLAAEHVVHHEDGDNRNNAIANLKVFASQSDHLAYHHGSPIAPLWDGASISTTSTPHASPIMPTSSLPAYQGDAGDEC